MGEVSARAQVVAMKRYPMHHDRTMTDSFYARAHIDRSKSCEQCECSCTKYDYRTSSTLLFGSTIRSLVEDPPCALFLYD
jgi:hypothetical protein